MEQRFCPACGGDDVRSVASADGTFEKTAFRCEECGWAGLGRQLVVFQDLGGERGAQGTADPGGERGAPS
jgi:hypothetical protein